MTSRADRAGRPTAGRCLGSALARAPGVRRGQLLDPCHEPRQCLRCRVTTEQLRDCEQRFLSTAGAMFNERQAAPRQRHLLASGVEALPQRHEALRRRGMSRPPTGRLPTQVATVCGRRRDGQWRPRRSKESRASIPRARAAGPLRPASRQCSGLLCHGIPGTKPWRVPATVGSARAVCKEPLPPQRDHAGWIAIS